MTKVRSMSRYLALAMLLTAVSCGGSKQIDNVSSAIDTNSNPAEQVNQLAGMVSNAKEQNVDALSPTWFEKAEASLQEASSLQKRGGNMNEIFTAVTEGKQQLEKANKAAEVARTAFPQAIEARSDARDAGATQFVGEYDAVEKRFIAMARSVEGGNLNAAKKGQSGVIKSYRAIEVKAIKEQTLGEASKVINQAVDQGAPKFAPKTLAQTRKYLSDTDTFISANPYAKEQLHERADKALFYAKRLLVVTQQSQAFEKSNSEDVTLWAEQSFQKISDHLKAPDMRNQSFRTQLENVNGTIDRLHQDHEFLRVENKTLKDHVADYKQKVASLQGETEQQRLAKERLEAEKRFNELYTEVRKNFDANEAEVYKEGDKLVVRLKTVQFPVGQYVIMPSNYTLLTKVQRTIRTFGDPNIVIEGHTDSTGSAAVNEHLSKKRAEAVRSYLIANHTLEAEQIKAIGYGEKRPLVANNTAEGRATNRRIDVIIQPNAPSAN